MVGNAELLTPACGRPARRWQSPRAAGWLACALIAITGWAAYANSLGGPFVFDGPSSITGNPTIRHLAWSALSPPAAALTVQGRPVLNLSLALNYALSGTAVWSYHAANLVIHVLAALALFGFLRRTLALSPVAPAGPAADCPARFPAGTPGPTAVAAVVALLWVAHPLQTEAVTYVIQRAESLMALFFVLTFYAFVRGAAGPRRRLWLGLAVVSCALGAATKEVTAVAPLLVLLYDRAFVSGGFRAAWRRHGWVHAGLMASWLLSAWLLFSTGGNRGGAFDFHAGAAWAYWLTQPVALARYAGLILWPHPLVFEYGTFWVQRWAAVFAPALLVMGLVVATLVALVRAPRLGFAGAWILAILAPTSVLPGTTQMIVEHRMYLPLAAALAIGVWVAARWLGRGALVAAALAVPALILLTARRNLDYRSAVALWTDTVTKRPANALAHQMLGMALQADGQPAAARAQFQDAVRLQPGFALAHDNLGLLLFQAGRETDAVSEFAAATRLQPEYAEAHDHLAVALAAKGQLRAALAEHRQALRLDADNAEFHFDYANALVQCGQPGAAVAQYQAAVRLRPDFPAAEFNLANTLSDLGQSARAVRHYKAALRLKPDYAPAYNNLGGAYLDLGHVREAADAYQAALRIDPHLSDARENLARIRAATGPVP